MCPICPTHKCCMSLYCLTCGEKCLKVVKKEEDPNFECQMCKFVIRSTSAHKGHEVFPVLYLIEEGIILFMEPRYNKSEEFLAKMKELLRTAKKNFATRFEII